MAHLKLLFFFYFTFLFLKSQSEALIKRKWDCKIESGVNFYLGFAVIFYIYSSKYFASLSAKNVSFKPIYPWWTSFTLKAAVGLKLAQYYLGEQLCYAQLLEAVLTSWGLVRKDSMCNLDTSSCSRVWNSYKSPLLPYCDRFLQNCGLFWVRFQQLCMENLTSTILKNYVAIWAQVGLYQITDSVSTWNQNFVVFFVWP